MAVPQGTLATDQHVAGIAFPDKVACPQPSHGATPGHFTSAEKSLEMPRYSGLSTPRSYRNEDPFDTDIEAMITTTSSTDPYALKSIATTKDCPSVWPDQQDWKAKAKAAKRERGSCACMARMSKRNRIIMKISIGLLIIGIGVAVGFGVSRPLGAPIWGDSEKQHQ